MATYTANSIVTLTGNTELFVNGLVQQIAAPAQPNVLNDANWFCNFSKLRDLIDGALSAQFYQQQYNAQACLDEAYSIIQSQQYYF